MSNSAGPGEATMKTTQAFPPAAATTMQPFQGRCFCGAITITLSPAEGKPLAAYLCHCLDCQRFSGSSFAHNAMFRVADLVVKHGQPTGTEKGGDGGPAQQLSTYGDDAEGRMQFCRACGTRLLLFCPAGSESMRDKVIVPVGVLDGGFEEARLAPSMEGWVKRKACWLRAVDLGLERMGAE